MNVFILQGSYRKNGHTKQLSVPFAEELCCQGVQVEEAWLCDYEIKPCLGCGTCQEHIDCLGCVHSDDFEVLFEKILRADIVVFAAPIYAGFAPGPMKTFMDRLIYAPVKRYGEQTAPSMLSGGACAILITSGYDPKRMVGPFETAIKILAERTGLEYLGWVGGTDPGKGYTFMNEKKAQRARDFAVELIKHVTGRKAERT